MKRGILPIMALATMLAAPLSAQFVVTVQENGQALSVANGGTITLNAPAVGQATTATVSVTYIGMGMAAFPEAATILGPTSFTTDAAPVTLTTFQAATFHITYTPASGSQASAQFLWNVNVTVGSGMTATTTPGALTFNLAGTAPNTVVGQVPSTGGFNPIANGGTITISPTVIGSPLTTTISISNTGSGPDTINSIAVSGPGYQLEGVPILPFTLTAGTQLQVGIEFLPASAGAGAGSLAISLGSGSFNASLSATAVMSLLSYQLVQGGVTSPITPGQTIVLAITNTGNPTATLQFQNTTTTPLTISGIGISGAGFSIADEPFLPVVVPPLQSNTVTISYTPQQSGSSTGRLQIGGDEFLLSGEALPSLPSYQFTGASGTEQPFTQPSIGLALSAPYPLNLTGILTLIDTAASFFADPAVQFSTGGRQVPFAIPAGTLQAVFPNASRQIQFQTGTAASTLTFTPTFTIGTANGISITPTVPASAEITVPSLSPVLLGAGLNGTTATSFSLVITGYTTTRALNSMTFQFTPVGGKTLSTTSATIDLSGASTVFFDSTAGQAVGGEFTVTIPFTLSNGQTITSTTNLTQDIASVAVTAMNSVGNSNSVQVVVQ